MLHFFRRHKGPFLIFIAVIIIITFSMWGGARPNTDRGAKPTDAAFSIYGDEYTIAEYKRFERYLQLAQMLGLYDLAQQLMMISYQPGSAGMNQGDIVFNLLVLRHEMDEIGIRPSDDEARESLKALPVFQVEGKFDPSRAKRAEENLGALGMTPADMLEIVKYSIGFSKLQELVTKNYAPSPLAAEKQYASRYQTIKTSTMAFKLEDFKKDVKVTDDEIKAYYEERKDSFMTNEQRAISYVLFENPADLDKKELEVRQKEQNAIVERVNAFNERSQEQGATLEKLATELKEKVTTQPLFTQATPPEALKDEADVVTSIFQSNPDVLAISDPVKGSKGYYIFNVTEIKAAEPKTLEAVKDEVKTALLDQKAQEAMTAAVNETRNALAEGLKEGKKIEDLAKEKKLTLEAQPDITVQSPPADMPNGVLIAGQVEGTPPGGLSKPVTVDDGALLVYVHDKELWKRDDAESLRTNIETSTERMERFRIFSAWFNNRRAASNLKTLIDFA